MRKKKSDRIPVQTYSHATEIIDYAGPVPSANDCYSKMYEDKNGEWVTLEDYETLYKKYQELSGELNNLIDKFKNK